MKDKDFLNFKKLLEYFISHLEWIVNNDSSFIGYQKYIEPFLKANNFKKTGQGYNGGKIQKQIFEWDHFEGNQVCINVTFNQRIGYQSKFCYINWIGTGINIIAEWEDNHIVGLYQELFIEKQKPQKSIWKNLNMSKSVEELGLFDESDKINENLKSFYENFRNELIKHQYRENHKKYMEKIEKKIKLLEYKKQIILQGPPGTGKTREAKLIANEIIGKSIYDKHILSTFKIGQKIKTPSGNKSYEIVEINSDSKKIKLKRESETEDYTSFKEIIDAYNNKLWNISLEQNNPRRAASLAKYVYDNLLENTEQFKLIQFHPSYTYEDFVRGIVAKPNPDGEGIIYEAENKTLGDFATKALDNFLASKGQLTIDSEFQTRFNTLIDEINSEINSGKIFKFGDKSTAEIISVGNEYLIYSFPERKEIRYKLLFSDIEKVYNKRQEINIPIDLRDKEKELGLQMKGKYPYYFMILKSLEKIELPENFNLENSDVEEKPYILVIDEINRTNLSSVLGELIYALEYRGEEVESMYEVDGSQKLILPPNLYIIGTMNTADRSVGHIDYAIRRRFAFVEVLPEKLKDNDEIFFNTSDFIDVAKLFIKVGEDQVLDFEKAENSDFLSDDFSAKDVALGHSYFIAEKKKISEDNKQEYFNMKMKYEVIPILNEYLKDGVFNEKATVKIKEIEQRFA